MADIVERFDYNIEPALRKLRSLKRETDRIGDVTRTVTVEVDGLDDITNAEALIDGLTDVVEIGLIVETSDLSEAESLIGALSETVEVDVVVLSDDLAEAESLIGNLNDTVEVEVFADVSDISNAESLIAGLSQNVTVDLDVDTADLDNFSASVDQVSTSLINLPIGGTTAGLAAIGGGVVAITKSLTGFESGLLEVATLLPDLDGDAIDQLGQDVREFSKEAGLTTDEVLPALYQAISAGVPRENVFEFLNQANEAAVAGISDIETAVDGLTSVVNAYGSDVLATADASDALFTAVRLGKTDFNQLADSIFDVAPLASSIGVEFSDVTAVLAQLTAQGTPTRVATTQLKGALAELQDSGSSVNEEFQKIAGETFPEFIANGGDLRGALGILEEAAEAAGIGTNELFGSIEAGQAILGITGKNAETFQGVLDEFGDTAGATQTAFATMDASLGRSFARIRSAAQVAFVEAANRLAPFIKQAVDIALVVAPQLGAALVAAASQLSGLGDVFQRVFGFVRDAIAPVLPLVEEFFYTLRTGFTFDEGNDVTDFAFFLRDTFAAILGLLTDRIEFLIETGSRIGAALRDGIGDVDIFAALTDAGERAAEILGRVQAVITRALDALLPAFEQIIGRIFEFFEAVDFGPLLDALGVAFETVFEVIEDIDFEKIFDNLADIFGFFLDVLEPIVEFLIDVFAPAFEDMGEVIANVVGFVANILEGDWSAAWNSAVAIVRSAVNLIVGIYSRITSALLSALAPLGSLLAGIWNGIAATAQAAWNGILSTIAGIVDGIVGAIQTAFSGIAGVVTSVMNTVAGVIDSAWSGIRSAVGGAVDGVVGIIEVGWSGLGSVTTSAWNGITGTISSAWSGITSTVSTGVSASVDAIVTGSQIWFDTIVTTMNAINGFLEGIWNTITGTVSGALSGIADTVASIWNGIVATITGAGNGIVSALAGIWTTITDAASVTWTAITDTISGALNDALAAITGLVGDFLSAGADLGTAIIDGLSGALSAAASSLASIGTAIANAIIGALNTGLQFINDAIPDSIPIPGLPDIDLPDNPLPQIPTLAEGAYIPATRGGFLALLAENRHGEVALNEGQSFARNVGLLSEFQGGTFLRQIAQEMRSAGGGGGEASYTDNRRYELTVPAPPTQNPKIWGDEIMAKMKNHARDQDRQRRRAA